MFPASVEQQKIIDSIATGNVVVDAVAGSGKTTTVLHIAKTYLDNMLLITYNKRLRLETINRANIFNIHNLEIHTYHSFCGTYFGMENATDQAIIKRLRQPMSLYVKWDIIIIDEAQDMKTEYYELVKHTITDDTRLLILGDVKQNIYRYAGSTDQYLKNPMQYFTNKYVWTRCNLSVSYRLTKNMILFLNECILNQDMFALVDKPDSNEKIKYVYTNPFKIFDWIKNDIANDIMILAPSVKTCNGSPLKSLVEEFEKRKINYHRPESDDVDVSDDELKNKIPILTFNQSKGLERKIVVVFNFDANYFKYYAKDLPKDICPNILYVSLTRAKEKLILIHDHKADEIEFLNTSKMINANYVNITGKTLKENIAGFIKKQISFLLDKKNKEYITNEYTKELNVTLTLVKKIENNTTPFYDILKKCYTNLQIISDFIKTATATTLKKESATVTEIIKHVDSKTILQAQEKFTKRIIQKPGKKINIQVSVNTGDASESIASINGIAIQAYYEYRQFNSITIFEIMKKDKNSILKRLHNADIFDFDNILNINQLILTNEILLKISALYEAYNTGYYNKITQIKKYDWLSETDLEECYKRMFNQIGDLLDSGYIEHSTCIITDNITIHGIVDFITDIVWEVKFTENLKDEHFIQLACYAYLLKINKPYYLYNVRTDEIQEIKFNMRDLQDMFKILIKNKFKIDFDDKMQYELTKEEIEYNDSANDREMENLLLFIYKKDKK